MLHTLSSTAPGAALLASLLLTPSGVAARPQEGGGREGAAGAHKAHGERGHGERGHGGGPCREDRARLCPDARGKEAVKACMQAHQADLSPACKEKLGRAESMKADCQADAAKYCAEVPPGGGRLMACLTGRKDDLQAACRTHVDEAIAHRKARKAEREARREKGERPPK